MQVHTTSEKSKSTSAVAAHKNKPKPFFAPVKVQPKLTIGAVDDPYEREADAMADHVMRMPSQQNATPNFTDNKNSFFSPKPISTFNVQRECATCEKEKLKRKEEKPEEEKNVIHRKEKSFDGGLNSIENTVQRKCTHCEEEEKIQKKSEGGASAGMEAPSIVHDVISSRGQTLDKGTRNFFEPRFGHDFSNVKIHDGSEAAASSKAINAHAYTAGNHIVFNTGKFAPYTESGRRLLGHELTHVVQQGKAGMVRRDTGGANSAETKEEFIERVFAMAVQRLRSNIANLQKWREYISERFSDLGLQAQVHAHEAIDLFRQSAMRGRTSHFETWCNLRRPNQRAVEEYVMRGLINGGCQFCHSSNLAWERDNNLLLRRGVSDFNAFPSPRDMLLFDAAYSEAERTGRSSGEAIPDVPFTTFGAGELNNNTHQLVEWIRQQEANQINNIAAGQNLPPQLSTNASPPSSSAPLPTSSSVPYHRSGLCNDLPAAEANPPAPTVDPSSVGACTLEALQAIARIRPELEPLGVTGYRVLPREVFSSLYSSTPSEIHSLVNQNIDIRQEQYQSLISKINERSVHYLTLCRIVDELFFTTNTDVQFAVMYDKVSRDFARSAVDFFITVGGIASLILMFVFPPAGLLLGALVGSAMIGRGAANIDRGLTYDMGRGAGVFARAQEESIDSLILSGVFDIFMGALNVITSTAGLARIAGRAGALPAHVDRWMGRPTPLGTMYVNQRYPAIAIWRRGFSIEITNSAGETIAYGGLTGNGWWLARGNVPAGALPEATAAAPAPNPAGMVPTGVPLSPSQPYSGFPFSPLQIGPPTPPMLLPPGFNTGQSPMGTPSPMQAPATRTPTITFIESTGAALRGPSFQSASAQTGRSMVTAIRADVAESEAYKMALLRGEIGLQRPMGSNVTGVDFITAIRGDDGMIRIIVTDVKSSTIGRFPAPNTSIPPSWMLEVQQAVGSGRLGLSNSLLEQEIRDAAQNLRIFKRQINADYSPSGQGRISGF